jgi:RNA methyltransferase, TrmH family
MYQVTTFIIVLQRMLSRAQNKYIRSLTQQKFRNEYNAFIAEGEKIALEWLSADIKIGMIVATADWADSNHSVISKHVEAELHIVKESELASISALQTPNKVVLVVPFSEKIDVPVLKEWYIALDDIQDPGNMGTIIRIADWFGIRHIVCSPGCVDVYNPKVVQSAMGGHLRVNIYESNLLPFLQSNPLTKFAATLNGENVYHMERQEAGVLVIGNESKGVSDDVLSVVSKRITIPRKGGAESLNAGVSAGILCALLLPC